MKKMLLLLLIISTLRNAGGVSAAPPTISLSYSIDEGANLDTFVGNLADSNIQASQFMILPSNTAGSKLFQIELNSGQLRVAAPIDYDDLTLCSTEPCYVTLQITVFPEYPIQTIQVRIRIRDINDNSPVFVQLSKTINLAEDQTKFETMLEKATDQDRGVNGQLQHSLLEKTGTFILTEKMDMLFLNLKSGITLDYESIKFYSAILEACDSGVPIKRCSKQGITIQITDVNDNNPEVVGSTIIDLNLREDYSTSQPLVQINATDRDSGDNARLMFRIGREASGTIKNTFMIGQDNGVLFLQQNFDAQQNSRYDVPIVISDNGANPRFAKAMVRVQVNDVNNHSPNVLITSAMFTMTGNKRIEVVENSVAGQIIAYVGASDGDLGDNAFLTCELPSAHAQWFSLTQHGERTPTGVTYKLKNNVRFDYETQQSIGIEVRCYDNGQPSLNTSSKVNVFILNENEFSPEFRSPSSYTADVIEGKSNELVLSVLATDNDTNSQVTYALDEMGAEKFTIDAIAGTISTKEELDREATARYVFNVFAMDNAEGSDVTGKQRTATAQVVVTVLDANDNAPLLLPPHIYNVEEGQPVMSSLRGGLNNQGRLVGQDLDDGENGRVGFQLLNVAAAGNVGPNFGNSTFTIGMAGQLLTSQILDRERVASYLLTICVFDYGKPTERKSVTVTVTVNVLDLDDEPPAWNFPRPNDNWVNITSEKMIGDEVTTVEAFDPDSTSNLTYTLLRGSGYFAVQHFTGKVVVTKELRAGQHELYLRVDDNAIPLNHFEEARLYINVYGIQSAQNLRDARINLTIIITMVVITTVISVALVAAIVCVRKRSLLPPTESCMTSEIDKGGVEPTCQCRCPDDVCHFQQATLPREPVYHQLCTSPNVDRLYPLSTFSTATIDRNYQNSATLKGVGQRVQQQLQHATSAQLTVEIRNNEVLVNNLDLDKESADSGRGASEEGGNFTISEHRAGVTQSHLMNRYPMDTRGISPVPFAVARPSSRASQRMSHANMSEFNSTSNCRCHILPEGEAVQSIGCICGVCGQESNSILLTGGQTNNDGYVSTYSRLQQPECQPPAYASLPRHAAAKTNSNAAYQQHYSQMTFSRRPCNPQPTTLPSSMPMVSFSSAFEPNKNDSVMAARGSRANHYVVSTSTANVSHS